MPDRYRHAAADYARPVAQAAARAEDLRFSSANPRSVAPAR
jgi:hypothetical protein